MAGASHEVSGKSLLWSMIVLGTNAMTQNSPSDHYYFLAFDSISPASSSPVICLGDLIGVIVYIACGLQAGLTLREAMGFYVAENALDVPGLGSPTSISFYVLKLAFFALGAVPQAVKIFAARGIPAVQIIAAIFLGAYVTRAVISAFYKPFAQFPHATKTKVWQARQRVQLILPDCVRSTGVGLIIVHLTHPLKILEEIMKKRYIFTMQSTLISELVVWGILFLSGCALIGTRSINTILNRPLDSTVGFLIMICWSCWFWYQGGIGAPINPISVLIGCLIDLCIWSLMQAPKYVRSQRQKRIFGVLFALYNFLQAILYFIFVYNSQGTYQYSWADVFG